MVSGPDQLLLNRVPSGGTFFSKPWKKFQTPESKLILRLFLIPHTKNRVLGKMCPHIKNSANIAFFQIKPANQPDFGGT